MFIDSHSHIYSPEFDHDREEVVARAVAANVRYIVLPDIDSTTRTALFTLADKHPDKMLPLSGIHPTSVNHTYREELAALEKQLGKRTPRGIGECGIDHYWDKTYYKEQMLVFEYQLNAAREAHLPIIIHSRESLPEIFKALKRQHDNLQGILHCFPGNEEDARRAIDLGFLLGIGGIVTYKKSLMAEVVQKIGPDRLVLETDAPYLSPTPYRGKRNESSYIPHIAAKIAGLLNCDTKKIEEITTNNAMNLFYLQQDLMQ